MQVGMVVGWKLLAQCRELVRLAAKVLAQTPAKYGLIRRSGGGHLVEKSLERCAEVLR
jgi:hypothetical protein